MTADTSLQALADRIKALRASRALTQEDLASMAGVGVATIQRAERGQRLSADTIASLAAALDMDARDLTGAVDGRQVPLYLFRLPDGSDMEMVAVPAGDFVMGADDLDAPDWEKPKHIHSVQRSYWIGRNAVTRGQFRVFCTAIGRAEPEKSHFDDELVGGQGSPPGDHGLVG